MIITAYLMRFFKSIIFQLIGLFIRILASYYTYSINQFFYYVKNESDFFKTRIFGLEYKLAWASFILGIATASDEVEQSPGLMLSLLIVDYGGICLVTLWSLDSVAG